MLPSLQDELKQFEEQGLRRSLRRVDGLSDAMIKVDGCPRVNFGSNNYLGLARHPLVVAAAKASLDEWGAGATASRLIAGTFGTHIEFEQKLATFVDQEAALVFPSGYMANLAVLTSLVGPGDAIVLDRLCHASLVDAARLSGARLFVYRHADVRDAERVLKRTKSYQRRMLVTESLFSMDGDFAPLEVLGELASHYGAIGLVDDAHAIGVWGERGRGLANASFDVVVGTLSKALGSQGGFVAGSKSLIDILINRGRSFIFTTALAPASVAAASVALDLIESEPERRSRLVSLSRRLRDGLQQIGFDTLTSQSQIVPIHLGAAEAALGMSAALWDQGVYAPAIRPPTVHAGECRLRVSLTADHRPEQIEALLAAAARYKGEHA